MLLFQSEMAGACSLLEGGATNKGKIRRPVSQSSPSVWPAAHRWNLLERTRERQQEFTAERPKQAAVPLVGADPCREFLTSTASSPLGRENKEKRKS